MIFKNIIEDRDTKCNKCKTIMKIGDKKCSSCKEKNPFLRDLEQYKKLNIVSITIFLIGLVVTIFVGKWSDNSVYLFESSFFITMMICICISFKAFLIKRKIMRSHFKTRPYRIFLIISIIIYFWILVPLLAKYLNNIDGVPINPITLLITATIIYFALYKLYVERLVIWFADFITAFIKGYKDEINK